MTALQSIFLQKPSAAGYFAISEPCLAAWERLGVLNIQKLIANDMLHLAKNDADPGFYMPIKYNVRWKDEKGNKYICSGQVND